MTSNPKCSSLHELDTLCKEIREKSEKEFDALIKKCNIDLGSNKQWANEYYSLVKSNTKLQKKIRAMKVGRWFLLIFLIFPFFLMTNAAKKKQKLLDEGLVKEKEAKEKLDKQLNEFVSLVSYDFMFKKIIEPIWKDVTLDIYQDANSYASWLPLVPKMITNDTCYLELISGKLFSNPFMIYNFKEQSWYMHVYTGSIPVTYTTRDSEGHMVTRTEVVVATETLPAPQWVVGTELAYHFDRPAKLCFANNATKRQLKKLNKKNIQSAMENKEFDKLFPATRTDEKDYRVVFTPLAQENYVKLFKEQNYQVLKNEDVTLIQLPQGGTLLDTTDNEAVNYDVQTWKDKYCKWVSNFVHTLGLLSLPIAAIPLYTQFETQIKSNNSGKQVASDAQVQENMTHMFNLLNMWSQFDTDVIFHPTHTQTVTVDKTQFSLTTVRCNYFYPEHRVIMKPGFSAHRGTVMVPIHVIYYRDRHKDLVMCQSINLNNNNYEGRFGNFIVHRGQIITLLNKPNLDPKNIDTIKKILQKIKKA